MAVSIQQAAQNALATYLKFQFADVQVEPRWVANDKKFPNGGKAITIIPAGHRVDHAVNIGLVASKNRAGNLADSVWQVAMCKQPLQLDVWTTAPTYRDDILARLDSVLRVGAGGLGDIYNFDPVSDSVLLHLSDGWTDTIADYSFENPDIDDTPGMAQRSLWRATVMGEVNVMLTVTATTARQRIINFNMYLDGASTPGV